MFSNLRDAIAHLKTDSIFESCIAVGRLMLDIHQENRNFVEMTQVYGDLHKLSNDIVISNASNSRMFANYYAVQFFGKDFGELDGKTYVYKERSMVRLGDIRARLQEQYEKKFGSCKSLSGNQAENLDPNTPALLIRAIRPYFTREELLSPDRRTPFEREFNIKRFIYETPLTTTGKVYSDDLTEQAKKKTILYTQHPFPFVIKRLPVVSLTEEKLSPIQTSLETLEDRCRLTLQEVDARPPNSKTLQIVLQGSVLLRK